MLFNIAAATVHSAAVVVPTVVSDANDATDATEAVAAVANVSSIFLIFSCCCYLLVLNVEIIICSIIVS